MFKSAGGEGFVVFNGPDEQFVSGRMMGADGGIGGTYGAMPELFLKADELFRTGQLDKARALQYDINEIIYALCACKGNMYGVITAVLKKRAGLELGGVREPLFNLVAEDMPKVDVAVSMIDKAMDKWL